MAERARARIDLAFVSVLLDAGAGQGWRFREAETGLMLSRSEGLAVASLRAMQRGLFSADPTRPWRADAEALARITPELLAGAFQHGPDNGWSGSTAAPRCCAGWARPAPPIPPGSARRRGRGISTTTCGGSAEALSAAEMLRTLLFALGPIWPGRISLDGVPLGDCGRHQAVPGDGLVPFHKLSQWLAYSLVEPLAERRGAGRSGSTG